VPDLDGTVKPLPKPELDPQDSKLAEALNELASIGEPNDEFADSPANAERKTSIPDSDPERQRPSPNLREFVVLGVDGQPIDFDSLPPHVGIAPEDAPSAAIRTMDEIPEPAAKLPAQPIDPSPADPPPVDPQSTPAKAAVSLPDDDSMKQKRPWAETAQPGDSWNQLIAAASDSPDPDSANSDKGPISEPGAKSNLSPQTVRKSSPGLLVALTGAAAVMFAAGFWVGRITTLSDGSAAETKPADFPGVDAEPTDRQDSKKPAVPIGAARPALRGRITVLAEGQRKPDKGARLIVLPKDRSGSVKLAVAGFRSGDSPEDHRVAVAALAAMGGAFTTTSDEGEFEISLPSSGQFYVLVLSNSLMREGDELDADVESAASPYFDRPSQLVGRVRCYVEEVRWNGDGTEPWDYSFRS